MYNGNKIKLKNLYCEMNNNMEDVEISEDDSLLIVTT